MHGTRMAHMSLTLSHAAHPPLSTAVRTHARLCRARSAWPNGHLDDPPLNVICSSERKNGGQSDWRIRAPTDRPRGILLEGLSDGRSLALGLDQRWTFGARVTWDLEAVNGVLKGLTEHSNVYN